MQGISQYIFAQMALPATHSLPGVIGLDLGLWSLKQHKYQTTTPKLGYPCTAQRQSDIAAKQGIRVGFKEAPDHCPPLSS